MIPFQARTFWRLLRTPGPMRATSPGARLRKIAFFLLFPVMELLHAAALALDPLLFPYRATPIRRPLFIVSPPRSGSTLLQRLLARDTGHFTSFALWQSLFPVLWLQLLLKSLGRTRIGAALRDQGRAIEARFFQRSDRYHRIRMEEVEEDELLFVHTCGSELLANLFPMPEVWKDYRNFDQMEEGRRRALMGWYRDCVARHQFVEGPGLQFLSKNPPFCHKIGSLKETFPDAIFVLLVRHPEEALCSCLSMLHAFRSSMGMKSEGWNRENVDPGIIDFVVDCYQNALRALEKLPSQDYRILLYEDLAKDPYESVRALYQQFGMTLSPEYQQVLQQQAQRPHRSEHHYDLAQFGISSAAVEALLPEVYQRFGFEYRSRRASA